MKTTLLTMVATKSRSMAVAIAARQVRDMILDPLVQVIGDAVLGDVSTRSYWCAYLLANKSWICPITLAMVVLGTKLRGG